jgi:predicted acylesterase/phospholipase RssA
MVDARLKVSEPDLFLRPEIKDVRVLEFWKGPEIVEGAQDAKERCLQWLQDRAVT